MYVIYSAQSSFVTVNLPTQAQELAETRLSGHADLYRPLINEQLTAGNHGQNARVQIDSSRVSKPQVPVSS
jgi:hypothetical protein